MNIFGIVYLVFGVALSVCVPMLIAHRRRIGEYMTAVGMGNKWGRSRPSVVAVYIGVTQALLGLALAIFGVVVQIFSGSPGREELSYFSLALILPPLMIAYASLGGGIFGMAHERGSKKASPENSTDSNVSREWMSWRESLRLGGGAFLIANGVLSVVIELWLIAMFLLVYQD